MTRKDYELIAAAFKRRMDVLAGFPDRKICSLIQEDITLLAEDLAGELAATNPAFDIARFLKACGVDA